MSNKLKVELLPRCYDTIMIRENNDVNISNAERSQIANNSNSYIFLKIHSDVDDNKALNGIMTLCQTPNNPYIKNPYKKKQNFN
ncbi:N-acetylmuramoyl-L-alanine amidase [Terrisporobacter mayombei]|uniref:N-acetylmuramoyl-L-alanine amidase n=1 Tax=Terrisporobacter mayombei TaxID=1541 RepID=UPI002ADD601D|nr:N-acetylmuramoyl-L-alanine amidase [Terrisporobacter mayombei]